MDIMGIQAVAGVTGLVDYWPIEILHVGLKRGEQARWIEASYADYPLRDKQAQQTWRINRETDRFELLVRGIKGERYVERDSQVKAVPAPKNAWLCWTQQDLAGAASDLGIRFEDAFLFTIPEYSNQQELKIEWDMAFGMSRF